MAFYSVIRRASTYITSLAFRAKRCSRGRGCSIATAKIIKSSRTNQSLDSFFVNPVLHFSSSTVAEKEKSKKRQQILQPDGNVYDRNLIRILNSEIKCVVDSDLFTIAVDVPSGFPFKVEDNAGRRTILLTREFEGENLKVEVDMPNKDSDSETETSIPIIIAVSKADSNRCLQFDARCFPDGFSVNHISLKKIGCSEDGLAYIGPNISKLSEDLRNALDKFLETRGLTSSTANFLLEYMMCKDTEEYLRWLRTLKKLIEH